MILESVSVKAQSRLYVSAGVSDVWIWGSINTWIEKEAFSFNYYTVDVEYERKLIGSFSLMTGVSFFNAGYSSSSYIFGSSSIFKANFIAVPLAVRWNMSNKNVFFIDAGITPFFLLNAHLKEGIYRFNRLYEMEGDITRYSNKIYFGSKFQFVIPVNRFQFAMYMQLPFSGQSSLKGLDGHWGLNRQQSTYLIADGFADYMIVGLKAGCRIR